jgi:hypothetical protein
MDRIYATRCDTGRATEQGGRPSSLAYIHLILELRLEHRFKFHDIALIIIRYGLGDAGSQGLADGRRRDVAATVQALTKTVRRNQPRRT